MKSIGYNPTSITSASTMATEILNRPHVKTEVERILEELGMGATDRLQRRAAIADGMVEETVTEIQTLNNNGEYETKSRQVTRRPVNAETRLKAMDRLDKLDGTEDRRHAQKEVLSAAMRQLSKAMLSDSMKPLEKVAEATPDHTHTSLPIHTDTIETNTPSIALDNGLTPESSKTESSGTIRKTTSSPIPPPPTTTGSNHDHRHASESKLRTATHSAQAVSYTHLRAHET